MAAPSSPADDIYAAADALAADSASAAAYAAVLRCAGGQQDIRLRILALPLLAQHAARQPAAAQTQAAAALAAAAGGAQDQGQADRRGPAQRQLAGVAAAAIARYAGTDGAAPLADALATALVARSGLPGGRQRGH